jgi:hypothetical protein
MSAPSHGQLAELWINASRNLLVDGHPFPNSPTKVLRRLRDTGTIDKVTEGRISAVIGLRNDLSHHESSTVLPPSTSSLSMVAKQINTLFDSLLYTATSLCVSGTRIQK